VPVYRLVPDRVANRIATDPIEAPSAPAPAPVTVTCSTASNCGNTIE
jgi:hypothetical protein